MTATTVAGITSLGRMFDTVLKHIVALVIRFEPGLRGLSGSEGVSLGVTGNSSPVGLFVFDLSTNSSKSKRCPGRLAKVPRVALRSFQD